jgi:hypothetical protein
MKLRDRADFLWNTNASSGFRASPAMYSQNRLAGRSTLTGCPEARPLGHGGRASSYGNVQTSREFSNRQQSRPADRAYSAWLLPISCDPAEPVWYPCPGFS